MVSSFCSAISAAFDDGIRRMEDVAVVATRKARRVLAVVESSSPRNDNNRTEGDDDGNDSERLRCCLEVGTENADVEAIIRSSAAAITSRRIISGLS